MAATDWLEAAVLPHVLGFGPAMVMPGLLYAALCTDVSAPTDSTPGTEVVGGGYARMPVVFAMVVDSNDQAANVQTLQWAVATAAWGDLQWVEIWDAPSGGNRYFYLPLVDPSDGVTPITVPVNDGDIMRIPAGLLIVTAD